MKQVTLRELRNKANKSYKEVADAAGISTPGYWQIENGKRGASYSTMVKLAGVFDTTPDAIFLEKQLTKS